MSRNSYMAGGENYPPIGSEDSPAMPPLNSHDLDGFEVFENIDALRYYEARVLHEDEQRFQDFLDSVADRPEVKAWLEALDANESAA